MSQPDRAKTIERLEASLSPGPHEVCAHGTASHCPDCDVVRDALTLLRAQPAPETGGWQAVREAIENERKWLAQQRDAADGNELYGEAYTLNLIRKKLEWVLSLLPPAPSTGDKK